jgi:transposase
MIKTRFPARLLPIGLRVLCWTAGHAELRLLAEPATVSARCPLSGSPSGRVPSRYVRTVSDLPWRGIAVTLEVRARRFFCDHGGHRKRQNEERLALGAVW